MYTNKIKSPFSTAIYDYAVKNIKEINAAFKKADISAKIVLTTHDEITIDTPEKEANAVISIIKNLIKHSEGK